jgi:two-component system nitrate/nitrite response regulator NarL
MLVEGRRSDEIATKLSISPNTVRTHIQNILTKLQVHSRLEAAAFAVRHGLVDLGRERRQS